MGPRAISDPGPVPRLDAAALRRWLALAASVAERSRNLVDSLNVFPIPDADTGTNVLLTLRSALDAVGLLPPGADAVQTSRAIADGAIRGARGNSGLLVSQALAALAETCASAPDPAGLRPVELVHALDRMAASTWAAVSRPVTGTLLTVAADAASAARDALAAGPERPATPVLIATAAALGAQESVVETGGLGHGPVDAGGAALMLLLTSLADTLDTAALPAPGPVPSPATDVSLQMLTDLAAGAPHQGAGAQAEGVSTGEFEVMYLLEATSAQASRLRTALERIGDSVGVVGTPDALGVGLFQVHVHTDTPRAALPRVGRARQICVHHLAPTPLIAEADEPPAPWLEVGGGDGRVVSFERLAARRSAGGPVPRPFHPRPASRVGVIACTRAPGLIEQLARAGAAVVLDPRREGITRAAGDLGADEVIVLPCDDDATTAAHEAARALAARAASAALGGGEGTHLTIGDTDDEAQVLAATVALAGQGEREGAQIGDLARRAWRAAAHVRTTALNGAAAEPDAVARAVAASLRADDEILTVILGRSALPDVGFMAREAAERPTGTVADPYGGEDDGGAGAADSADAVEVIVLAGDQPTPDVLLAFE
ncbi:DAK2 domain-containing protein [Actinomyces gaoshouyii]|uniref:DAK2 domain-containing protein n=1 Tax=Actinomyces gaoshouyii TaxID=1960083 RepID=UPI0009C0C9C7|nr:DAK2 domain-containing protein [Actinomyces gaoshouyii]ARD41496.1 glycerol kinase [Actinomyces gaoshouyii]